MKIELLLNIIKKLKSEKILFVADVKLDINNYSLGNKISYMTRCHY